MADLEALHARRAAQRAQRRRRRQLRLLAGLVLLASLGGIVVVLATGGGASPGAGTRVAARSAASPPHIAAPRLATPRRPSTGLRNIERLIALGRPIYCAGPRGNAVAFTFDDGPGPYTHLALRKLRQAHEQATFFVVGRSMNNFPGWLTRELAVGAIGDHTYTHPFLPGLSPAGIFQEIASDRNQIERDSGRRIYLFRPPYGARDATVDETAKRLGLLEILWTVDSADSLGANWAGIIANVERGLHPGAIILMHENRGQTIRALTTLLPYLHQHHLRSVSLPELFASDPPSVAQVLEGGRGCGEAPQATTGS